jgi:hypothetical protein
MPHTALLTRIRAEYLEMPGLSLTSEQVQRLCGADRLLCQRVLDMLVDVKFLCAKPNGTYARLTEGPNSPRPHPAKADLGAGTCREGFMRKPDGTFPS